MKPNSQQADSKYIILHHTKQKFKNMTSSIMLTSSLINSKNKLGKLRQDQHNHAICLNPSSYKQILTTNKIRAKDSQRYTNSAKQEIISNISRLKNYAKKLDQDLVCKLDKENKQTQYQQPRLRTITAFNQSLMHSSRVRSNLKSTKSKIAKGRPEIYAKIRRKKILMDLQQDEHKSIETIDNQQNHQLPSCQIITKNSLYKYISNYSSKGSNQKIIAKMIQQKGAQPISQKRKFFAIRNLNVKRRSLACFKSYQNMSYINKGKLLNNMQQKNNKSNKFSIRNPRHSISNTIQ